MMSKTGFVPRLRFLEFRDGPTWLAPKLSDLYGFKRTNTLSRDKLNYETGTIRNIHYGDIHTKFKPLFRAGDECLPFINPDASINSFDDGAFCAQGDIVLADASEDLDDVGKAIEIVALDGERVVAGMHTILATRRGSHPVVGFGGHLFQSAAVRAGIKKEAQGAKVYGISANRISTVQVPIPPTVAEQQKIADCLTSIDDLITAEAQKLDALKTHKKGLMQQLFPAEGEVIPELRFPEFRDTGDWDEKQLGKLSEIVRGGSPRPIDDFLTIDQTGLNWLKIGDVDRDSKYITHTQEKVRIEALRKTREVYPGDLILSNSMSFGRPYILDIKSCIHDGWIAITQLHSRVDRDYLYYQVGSPRSQAFFVNNAAGGGVQNLNADIIKSLLVSLPSANEQQKIAECLTSIDDLITAEAQKLDALKTHKKGLMQQLFPTSDEVKV